MSTTNPAPNDNANKPRVFISHSSKDNAIVRWLVDELEKANLNVWFDERSLNVGDSIPEEIGNGLGASDYLVVLLSHNSEESKWVRHEWNTALMNQLSGKGVKVLPIRLDDAEMPTLLSAIKYADFRDDPKEGLRLLLRAIGGNAAAGYAATASAPPLPAQPRFDRRRLVAILQSLDDTSWTTIVTRIEGARSRVRSRETVTTQVDDLITWVEGPVGPGIGEVAKVAVEAFPVLRGKITPS